MAARCKGFVLAVLTGGKDSRPITAHVAAPAEAVVVLLTALDPMSDCAQPLSTLA